jgi:hypothetical protein
LYNFSSLCFFPFLVLLCCRLSNFSDLSNIYSHCSRAKHVPQNDISGYDPNQLYHKQKCESKCLPWATKPLWDHLNLPRSISANTLCYPDPRYHAITSPVLHFPAPIPAFAPYHIQLSDSTSTCLIEPIRSSSFYRLYHNLITSCVPFHSSPSFFITYFFNFATVHALWFHYHCPARDLWRLCSITFVSVDTWFRFS